MMASRIATMSASAFASTPSFSSRMTARLSSSMPSIALTIESRWLLQRRLASDARGQRIQKRNDLRHLFLDCLRELVLAAAGVNDPVLDGSVDAPQRIVHHGQHMLDGLWRPVGHLRTDLLAEPPDLYLNLSRDADGLIETCCVLNLLGRSLSQRTYLPQLAEGIVRDVVNCDTCLSRDRRDIGLNGAPNVSNRRSHVHQRASCAVNDDIRTAPEGLLRSLTACLTFDSIARDPASGEAAEAAHAFHRVVSSRPPRD